MDTKSLAKRVMSSVLVLIVVGAVVFLFPNWVFALLASALSGLALAEFFAMVEHRGIFVYKYFGIIAGMVVPIIVHLQMGIEGYSTLEPFFIVIASLFIFILQFIKKDGAHALDSIAVTLFGLLYISWFLSFFIKLRFLPHGTLLVGYVILVTKMGDVGAYFTGSILGRHGLIPRISPHKTIEGTVGGLLASLGSSLISMLYLPEFPLGHIIVLGVLLGVLAQVGDLAESLIKRDCKVKDSGASIPGFGGVLDMLDSLLFTVPIFYFYVAVLMKR